jgi:hypothetical protein
MELILKVVGAGFMGVLVTFSMPLIVAAPMLFLQGLKEAWNDSFFMFIVFLIFNLPIALFPFFVIWYVFSIHFLVGVAFMATQIAIMAWANSPLNSD